MDTHKITHRGHGAVQAEQTTVPRSLMREAASMLQNSMFQFCETTEKAAGLASRIYAALAVPSADGALQIAQDAIELITKFHSQATPDETPEMSPVFPAAAFQEFVDGHAKLMYRLAHLPQGQSAEDAAQRGDDFTKIVRATTGQQVLFFKEQDFDDGNVLHCVAQFDGFQADLKIGGIPDTEFAKALNRVDLETADKVLAQVAELGLSEVSRG